MTGPGSLKVDAVEPTLPTWDRPARTANETRLYAVQDICNQALAPTADLTGAELARWVLDAIAAIPGPGAQHH